MDNLDVLAAYIYNFFMWLSLFIFKFGSFIIESDCTTLQS